MVDWQDKWTKYLKAEEYPWECQELRDFRKKAWRTDYRVWSEVIQPRYLNLVEHFGGELSEELQRKFAKNWRKDYILENLQTHDSEKLFRALKQEFGDLVVDYEKVNEYNKDFMNVVVLGTKDQPRSQNVAYLKSSKEMKHLLDMYGYTLTAEWPFGIQLEPNQPESANEYIYGTCKGQLYHITDPESAATILQVGLRCRNGKRDPVTKKITKTREYPERIYVYAVKPKKAYLLKQDLRDLANVVSNTPDAVVLKIDVWGMNIDFYKDTAMGDNKFFTYTNIPAGCIKVFDRFTLEA